MWNDVETTQDLLNFKVVADTAAKMIKDSNGQPVSIGVSGSWGVGKSSLVQMIGESLKNHVGGANYIFIDFNAWLYQGYDDARMALLQKVADKIMEESKARKTCIDKAKDFSKRINWLRTATLLTHISAGLFTGAAIGILSPKELPNQEKKESVPKEIEALRSLFQELLENLKLTLVVLVDDLDRCLPNTAISTLEAMRLLLFIPQTAFIIAADEQMIRNAVRSHFGNVDLGDEIVTSYFDKLIQIPIRVPRLGINEVKGYLILLLVDLAQRRGKITQKEKEHGHNAIVGAIRKSWAGALTKKVIEDAYGKAAPKLAIQIDMADQLANTMATSDRIAGNPRLIKRFLNDLVIRESIAKEQEMSVSFDALVKLQLFERCAPAAAFEHLAKQVGDSEDGKPKFLQEFESKIVKAEEITFPNDSWKDPFISDWLKLNPPLANIDLRPLLYLSRDKVLSLASFDELSPDGRDLLSALSEAKGLLQFLVTDIKQIGVIESEKILTRMKRKARNQQWEFNTILQVLHLPKAFPELATSFIAMLDEIPASKRPAPLIPQLRTEPWAKELLSRWGQDEGSPVPVKKAINTSWGKK